ncbi:MAG: DUF1018 domain-containing protein [Ignavibacteriales bacterium]|nr:MAG: DUF1018 domain-containing protein [Ignavibacteriales bacterium]
MEKANNRQKWFIHDARKFFGLSSADYESLLGGYGVKSAKDLSYKDAEDMLAKLQERGWTPPEKKTDTVKPVSRSVELYGWGKKKYEALRKRGYPYPEPQKLRMIEALWKDLARNKSDESLQRFIENLTGISDITMLYDEHAKIVITALQSMKAARERKSSTNKKAASN